MYLINQDRDRAFELLPTDRIAVQIRIFNGVTMGWNLTCRNVLLGTFESIMEAIEEKARIEAWELPYYIVSGYQAWEVWEAVKEIMEEG